MHPDDAPPTRRTTRSIREALTAATCTLLGTHAVVPAQASEFRTGLLFYTEFDRVTAFEAVGTVRKPLNPKLDFELGLVVDILTGASANGAGASDIVQTFTRPSGRGNFQVPAGDTPLDDTFQDNRGELSADLQQTLGSDTRVRLGGNSSIEYDYRSLALRGSIAQDLFKKNTTLQVGASHGWDAIFPEGGIPVPFAPMLPAGNAPIRSGSSDTKTVLDLMVGLTQILTPSSLAQLNYTRSKSEGYLADPFKFTTLVAPADAANAGRPVAYLYENRPRDRTQQAVFVQFKQHWSRLITEVSYRYVWDSWELRSHTVDLKTRIPAGSWFVEPHVRLYHQSGVSFYNASLISTDPLPLLSTPDYRQGQFTGTTVGFRVDPGSALPHWAFRLEYYLQSGPEPENKIGAQQQVTLFPSVGALIAQVSYAFDAW